MIKKLAARDVELSIDGEPIDIDDLEFEGMDMEPVLRELNDGEKLVVAKAAAVMRPCVAAFAEQMELELRENDGKGGWVGHEYDKIGDVKYLVRRLKQEVAELELAVARYTERQLADPSKIVSESADVGNFAMMIADSVGGLRSDRGSYGK